VGSTVILMASSAAAAVGVCIVRWAALHVMRALSLPDLTRRHQSHGSGDGLTAADLVARQLWCT
jgi:hypothetical protein